MDPTIVDYLFLIGIYLIFLPAYCPFFNPIELVFSVVKARCQSVYGRKGEEEMILGEVLLSLFENDMLSTFTHCGYNADGSFTPKQYFERQK
jgi:hypothetical protein